MAACAGAKQPFETGSPGLQTWQILDPPPGGGSFTLLFRARHSNETDSGVTTILFPKWVFSNSPIFRFKCLQA